jgi:biotin carboxyl carrier protein
MRELQAIEHGGDDAGRELCCPRVGRFSFALDEGDWVRPGTPIGTLRVLNSRFLVVAPVGVSGRVSELTRAGAVGYRGRLLRVCEVLGTEPDSVSDDSQETAEGVGGIEINSPIDGIFYCRPTPEDPPFVAVGDELTQGQTLGLIEVMKTFNPVKFEGQALPGRVRLLQVLVTDLQEVAAGQVLFVVGLSSSE